MSEGAHVWHMLAHGPRQTLRTGDLLVLPGCFDMVLAVGVV